jgi:hypothetical protein
LHSTLTAKLIHQKLINSQAQQFMQGEEFSHFRDYEKVPYDGKWTILPSTIILGFVRNLSGGFGDEGESVQPVLKLLLQQSVDEAMAFHEAQSLKALGDHLHIETNKAKPTKQRERTLKIQKLQELRKYQ